VDIDFAAGRDEGKLNIWVENAAAGGCFIEELVLFGNCAETGKQFERRCYIGGNRSLAGFSSVNVDPTMTLQAVAKDVWKENSQRLAIVLVAQARVSTGRAMPIPESSVTYDAEISRTGDLFSLARKQPVGGIENH
jgi:hypothetical protein